MTLDHLQSIQFEQADVLSIVSAASANELDDLPFGIIHFDADLIVRRYNRYEQMHAGLRAETVVGMHVFTELVQCMNNFMVAEVFAAAKAEGADLDATIDYVLTWKMKPTPVKLRMLSTPSQAGGYVLLKRMN